MISRREELKYFLQYLYDDSTIYLNRKYEKYKDCMGKYSTMKFRTPPKTNYNKQ